MFRFTQKEHLIVPAHTDHLVNLRDFIIQIGKKYHYSQKLVNAFKLALDEAATNIINHAYSENEGYITVQAIISRKRLTVKLLDQGSFFDPKWSKDFDLQAHVDRGEKKGLGIFMMRRLLDDIQYEKKDIGNQLVLTKMDPDPKSRLSFKYLWEMPPALRIRYFVHAILILTLLNLAGFAFFYFQAGKKARMNVVADGRARTNQISDQITGVKPELLGGPDGFSYISAIVSPALKKNMGKIHKLAIEDSVGFICWSTQPGDVTSYFQRPEDAFELEADTYKYSLIDSTGILEFEQTLSFSGDKFILSRIHVFLAEEIVENERHLLQLDYLKTACLTLGASYLLLALLSYLFSSPVRKLSRWIRDIKTGEAKVDLEVDTSSELGEIAQAFSEINEKFSASQKHLAQSEKIEKEIKAAQDIQTSLLPKKLPQIDSLQIQAYYEPAESVSGDYYDFIQIDEHHLGIVIADVSGKGVPGSLIMTMIRTAIRTEARGVKDAAEVLCRVNETVTSDMKAGIFVTILYLIINTKTGVAQFASAGHTPLLIHRGETDRLFSIKPGGLPVGLQLQESESFEDSVVPETVALKPKDTIILYTDGVTESMNRARRTFGERKLYSAIRKHVLLTADRIAEKLRLSIYSFREDTTAQDDMTFVIVKAKDFESAEANHNVIDIETRFLDIEVVEKIHDIVRKYPGWDAYDISRSLHLKEYGQLEIEPGKVQAELNRRQLGTRNERQQYVSREQNDKDKAHPKSRSSTMDTAAFSEKPDLEQVLKKKKHSEKTERQTQGGSGENASSASPPNESTANPDSPALPSEKNALSPDIEADFVFGDFIDDLISSTKEGAIEGQKAQPKSKKSKKARKKKGVEKPATTGAVDLFSDGDLSDSLIDAIFDNYDEDIAAIAREEDADLEAPLQSDEHVVTQMPEPVVVSPTSNAEAERADVSPQETEVTASENVDTDEESDSARQSEEQAEGLAEETREPADNIQEDVPSERDKDKTDSELAQLPEGAELEHSVDNLELEPSASSGETDLIVEEKNESEFQQLPAIIETQAEIQDGKGNQEQEHQLQDNSEKPVESTSEAPAEPIQKEITPAATPEKTEVSATSSARIIKAGNKQELPAKPVEQPTDVEAKTRPSRQSGTIAEPQEEHYSETAESTEEPEAALQKDSTIAVETDQDPAEQTEDRNKEAQAKLESEEVTVEETSETPAELETTSETIAPEARDEDAAAAQLAETEELEETKQTVEPEIESEETIPAAVDVDPTRAGSSEGAEVVDSVSQADPATPPMEEEPPGQLSQEALDDVNLETIEAEPVIEAAPEPENKAEAIATPETSDVVPEEAIEKEAAATESQIVEDVSSVHVDEASDKTVLPKPPDITDATPTLSTDTAEVPPDTESRVKSEEEIQVETGFASAETHSSDTAEESVEISPLLTDRGALEEDDSDSKDEDLSQHSSELVQDESDNITSSESGDLDSPPGLDKSLIPAIFDDLEEIEPDSAAPKSETGSDTFVTVDDGPSIEDVFVESGDSFIDELSALGEIEEPIDDQPEHKSTEPEEVVAESAAEDDKVTDFYDANVDDLLAIAGPSSEFLEETKSAEEPAEAHEPSPAPEPEKAEISAERLPRLIEIKCDEFEDRYKRRISRVRRSVEPEEVQSPLESKQDQGSETKSQLVQKTKADDVSKPEQAQPQDTVKTDERESAVETAQQIQNAEQASQEKTDAPEPAIQRQEPNLGDLVQLGIKAYKERDYESAIIQFNKVLKIDPSFSDAYAMLGNAYFRNNMWNEAIQSYEILQQSGRADSSVYENLGLIYLRLGLAELALKQWKIVLKLHPHRTDLAKRVQQISQELQKKEEASESKIAAQNGSASNKSQSDSGPNGNAKALALLQRGVDLYKNQRHSAAISAFQDAVQMFPNKIDGYRFLGNAYFRSKMYKEAAEVFERVKMLDEKDLRSRENLGLIHVKQGNYEGALAEWRGVLEKEPHREDLKRRIEKMQEIG